MKYIRTKDEIIDLIKLSNLDINDRGDITWYDDAEKYGHMIDYEDIIKTADTIEELCDAYVIIYKDGTKGILFMPTEINTKLAKTETVYGAIWTDKGLIYVAKMNEKGELELC